MNTSASITKMTVRIRKRPEREFTTLSRPFPCRQGITRCTSLTTRFTTGLSNSLGEK
jgi:hypothetical protein